MRCGYKMRNNQKETKMAAESKMATKNKMATKKIKNTNDTCFKGVFGVKKSDENISLEKKCQF